MTRKEANDYYAALCAKLASKEFEVVSNNDRVHNAVIERLILENSQLVNMYCGEMSVFREGFYFHINQNNQIEHEDQPLGDILKMDVIQALQDFIDRPNTKLNIYFEKYDGSYLRDLITTKVFRNGVQLGKINLFKLNDALFLKTGIGHTTCTDSGIMRIERDPQTHEAVCGLNIPNDILELTTSTFETMASVGEKIENFN